MLLSPPGRPATPSRGDLQAETTKLVLLGCLLQGITAPLSGVVLQTGFLRMEGCTVTNCHIALDIYPSAAVYVRNNDISFNEVRPTCTVTWASSILQ